MTQQGFVCGHGADSRTVCPCPENCYCRTGKCASKTTSPAEPIEDMSICARCKRADCRALKCDGGAPQPFTQPALMITVGDYKIKELVSLGRSIWGNYRYRLDEVVVRLMVGVGDLARLARTGEPRYPVQSPEFANEVKKELGNIIFSTIRWCDDLGFDVTECLALAIEAQRKFAQSGKPR